ncbi:hypothetical protein MMC08_002530 [Hypocenomyce scalaris]|nr:hypothetical protein [Hypocenomyce scalaris]
MSDPTDELIIAHQNPAASVGTSTDESSFGEEHILFIQYLHSKGVTNDRIATRLRKTFPNLLDSLPEQRRVVAVRGKVAVYSSKWADSVGSDKAKVNTYRWGPTLVEEMWTQWIGGRDEEAQNLISL